MDSTFPSFPFVTLLDWYHVHGRHDLPWRQAWHLDSRALGYRVWLSEVLLQQTQVSRASEYYTRILTHYPDITDLARADFETFFADWKGLGYYRRARLMLATAHEVTHTHGGILPREYTTLRTLPGIGEYTAHAIQAFVYDMPVLAVDTNLRKIFARYYYGDRRHPIDPPLLLSIREDFAASGLSGRAMNAILMDFGSIISLGRPDHIDFTQYPLPGCAFGMSHGASEQVESIRRVVFPRVDASIVVILHHDHRTYYSTDRDQYQPFILPPTSDDPRHSVQDYFREKHSLEVSVRPIRWRGYHENIPYMICNAQIQTG